MILTGHQPNYLPYAGFFHKIALADEFVIVDNVQFVKRGPFGWIHRNKIRTPQGWDWLTIPTLTSGRYTQTIKEAKIDNSIPWRRKHWRSIEWNYNKAPFFKEYADKLKAVYDMEWESISGLNIHFIKILLDILDIKIPIHIASELDIEGRATNLVINICKKLEATTYISGIHGKDYLEESRFKENNIELIYQEFKHPEYKQCQEGTFIPNLSVIDVLFNCGHKGLGIIMGK